MILRLGRFDLFAYSEEQESGIQTKLGISWYWNWFNKQRLYTLKKDIYFGPSITVYLFFGNKVVHLGIEAARWTKQP